MSDDSEFKRYYELAKKDKVLWKKQFINILTSIVCSLLNIIRNYTVGFVLVFSFSYWDHGFELMSSIDRDMTFIIFWSLVFGFGTWAIEVALFNLSGFKNVFKLYANERVAVEDIKNSMRNEIYPNIKEYVPWYINNFMQEEMIKNNNKQ
jgi:hypothetical protein